VVAFDRTNVFTYPGGKHSSGAEDAAIVATHLMLAATNAAADSCWINFFDPEAAAKALGLPENEEVLMLLDLGHAAEDGKPLPNHSSRKALTETVSYL
jgi:nitroreductase